MTQSVTPTGTTTSPRRRYWSLAVALVAVALVAALVWREDIVEAVTPEPRAEAGQVFQVYTTQVPGDAEIVTLPTAQLGIHLGEPVQQLPADAAGASEDAGPLLAPEGGAYLPVVIGTESMVPSAWMPGAEQVLPEVVIESGGQRFDLSSQVARVLPARSTGLLVPILPVLGVYLAVDGPGSDATVTVTFDGESQTLRADGTLEAGRFETIDPSVEPRSSGCERGEQPLDGLVTYIPEDSGVFFYGSPYDRGLGNCFLNGIDTEPWVAGLGWAPEGSRWLTMGLRLDIADDQLVDADDRSVQWEIVDDESGEVRARTGGEDATVFATATAQDWGMQADPWSSEWVIVVPIPEDAERPHAELQYDLPVQRPDSGEPGSVTATWQVEVPVGP
ncbi:hypothetical protein [Georgenia alba]|uniref:Uncharacterized protein n=1 Tax=Georgenia alba TaxID=2233858 RepID=A0ABW2Q7A0_9MICO